MNLKNRTQYIASLLFALLLCASSVRGQDDSATLYIELLVEDVVASEHTERMTLQRQEFLTQVNTYLMREDVPVVLLDCNTCSEYSYYWGQPSLQLDFKNYADVTALHISTYTTQTSPRSSALAAGFSYSVALIIDPNNEASSDLALTVAKGLMEYVLGDWRESASILGQALDHSRTAMSSELYTATAVEFFHATSLLELGQFQRAQQYYEDMLTAPNNSLDVVWTAAVNLTWIELQDGQDENDFEWIDAAIESMTAHENRDLPRALTKRSQLYALAFRFDEAIADMDAAIELNPDNPYLYVERGQRILLLYEWDRALADYNYALVLDPYYADAYYYRGILYASVPEGVDARAEAVADFQHYLDMAAPLGAHTEDAERYIAEIQAQLEAVGD